MNDKKKGSWVMGICSIVYLMVAICLLLGVCGYCYPAIGTWSKMIISGAEDSPVREAFHVLSDGLQSGAPIKDTALESLQVLFVDEN